MWRSPGSHWAGWEPAPAAHLALECGGSAVQCRATRGRASPDIIPVTHIGNFLENVLFCFVRWTLIALSRIYPLKQLAILPKFRVEMKIRT